MLEKPISQGMHVTPDSTAVYCHSVMTSNAVIADNLRRTLTGLNEHPEHSIRLHQLYVPWL